MLKFFSKQKDLPSKEEMLAETNREMEERWAQGYKKRQAHMMGPAQVCVSSIALLIFYTYYKYV